MSQRSTKLLIRCLLACSLGGAPSLAWATSADASAADAMCDTASLIEASRVGLDRGSPALKRYLRALWVEAAQQLPDEGLLRALEREQDPQVVEAVGAALARKAETEERPELIAALLRRAVQDGDPGVRAAAVRSLRGTGSVELMAQANAEVDYRRLIGDGAPEVRQAVVDNLRVEDREVYSGHSEQLSEAALAVAQAAADGAAAARIVAELSTEALGAESARWLGRALSDDNASLQVAAARALGGVSPALAAEARAALLQRYDANGELEVRRAILASLARLERGHAVPLFESLRSIDPRLEPDLDAWIAVLQRGLPEWALIEREHNAR
ncbi:MAG: hypothetical protein IT383_27810 [Deltaproteobacteria bacterium]|nr:hypothetical protein [Deltaproteobacteria bacterium]